MELQVWIFLQCRGSTKEKLCNRSIVLINVTDDQASPPENQWYNLNSCCYVCFYPSAHSLVVVAILVVI